MGSVVRALALRAVAARDDIKCATHEGSTVQQQHDAHLQRVTLALQPQQRRRALVALGRLRRIGSNQRRNVLAELAGRGGRWDR